MGGQVHSYICSVHNMPPALNRVIRPTYQNVKPRNIATNAIVKMWLLLQFDLIDKLQMNLF